MLLKKIIAVSVMSISIICLGSNKPKLVVPLGSGPAPARPPRPATMPGTAQSKTHKRDHKELSPKARAAAKNGSAQLALASLEYQQSDRMENERSGHAKIGAGTLTNLSDLDDDHDIEAQLLPPPNTPLLHMPSNSLVAGKALSHAHIAKQLAAKFPGYFSSVSDIEKHVEDLALHNPGLHDVLAGHVAALQNPVTITRRKKNSKHQKHGNESLVSDASQEAEQFLTAQMMGFLKKDRDAHAANSSYYQKWTYGSGVSTIISVLYFAFTHCTKKQSGCD